MLSWITLFFIATGSKNHASFHISSYNLFKKYLLSFYLSWLTSIHNLMVWIPVFGIKMLRVGLVSSSCSRLQGRPFNEALFNNNKRFHSLVLQCLFFCRIISLFRSGKKTFFNLLPLWMVKSTLLRLAKQFSLHIRILGHLYFHQLVHLESSGWMKCFSFHFNYKNISNSSSRR